MANYTQNLNLKKPLQTEAYNIDDHNTNSDKIDAAITSVEDVIKQHREANPLDHPANSVTDSHIGARTITDQGSIISASDMAVNSRGLLTVLLSRLAEMVRKITGEAHWYSTPKMTIKAISEKIANLDFIPTAKIGASENQIATLGAGGRYGKDLLPDDVVYDGDFTGNIQKNGWCKLPNGLLMQWGETTYGKSGYHYVSFHIPFTQVFSVQASYNRYSGAGSYRAVAEVTTEGFQCGKDGCTTFWIAIGI